MTSPVPPNDVALGEETEKESLIFSSLVLTFNIAKFGRIEIVGFSSKLWFCYLLYD